MLMAVADHAGHALALPEIAIEEHLSHYAHEVEELHKTARSAVRQYNAKLQTIQTYDVGDLALEPIMQSVSAELQKIFTILPTPEWAARESLLREARRQAPAGRSWDAKGEGARDAAIWLTAVHALRTLDETIYFVSMDKRAFGDGTLLSELAADLGTNADRFVYCCGIDALLKELATPYTGKVGREEIESSPIVRDVVRAATANSDLFFAIVNGAGLSGQGHVISRTGNQKLTVAGSPRVFSYTLPGREKVWVCASIRWNLEEGITATFIDLTPSMSRVIGVSFLFSTTLLMELDDSGAICSASLLHIGGIRDFKAAVTE